MSGAQTSPFPNQNDLLANNAQQLANYYAPERNRLFIEGAKQEQGQREMEVMSRVSAGLMNLPEDQRAAAYPGAVQYVQSLGYAKNAPPVYPGHDRIAQLASLGIPAEKQYEQQGVRSAADTFRQSLTGNTGTAGSTPAVPGGAYGTGGGNTAQVPAELMPHFQEASARTGIPVDVLIAQARQESSFNANAVGGAGEIGIGQILPSTARSPGYGLPGVDPAALKDPRTNINFQADYLKALLPPGADPKDPAAIRAALLRYNGGGDPNYVNNVTRYLPAPGGTTTAAAPAPGGGVPARIPGAVNVAGPGAGTAPAPVAPAPGGTTAEQPGNQGLMNRLSVFGGAGSPAEPAEAPVVAAPAVAPVAPTPTATAIPPPVLPPLPPAPERTLSTGLTVSQTKTLVDEAAIARTPQQLAALQAKAQEYRQQNDTRAKEYEQAVYARNEKLEAHKIAVAQEQRAQDKAAREAAAAADPIQGTDDKSNSDRTLFKYADKIDAGTATKEERRLYAQAAQYYLKPQVQWVDDPTDPSKKIPMPVDGKLPVGFPHPSYQPGDENKPPPPAPAVKTDFKPLPDGERKILIDTATKLDEINVQRGKFKPDYGGFVSAAYGDAQDLAARNNPFASKEAKARATWWQDYQVLKLAVRQGISGQSLTEGEKYEFDKADINPGMSEDLIRTNLERQDKILRTAHERRIGSLAADRYSPEAIEKAGGLNPAKLEGRPLVPSGGSPKPVGTLKVVIP